MQQITDKGLETNGNGVKEKGEAYADNKMHEQTDLEAPAKVRVSYSR